MNWFEKIIYALAGGMNPPEMYSPFHIVSILLTLLATVCLCFWWLKRPNEKGLRILVFVCWAVAALLEIYKQVVFSFSYDGEGQTVTWNYSWYAFPFQFCSSPLYLLPFIVFLKDGKLRDSMLSFLSTFGLFGGLIVMIYPSTVFTETVGINIQTMIHHGLQIALGILFAVYSRKKINLFWFFRGILVYFVMVAIAQLLNFLVPLRIDEEFNMFYISPKFDCILPVLSTIYVKMPYPVFFLIYLFGFIMIATIIYGISRLTFFLIALLKKKATKESM